uniref:Putative secreted protein n=1 Tax=Anopheles darlingi TaxID=43151 RepID=A0A2M4D1J4_ANODA
MLLLLAAAAAAAAVVGAAAVIVVAVYEHEPERDADGCCGELVVVVEKMMKTTSLACAQGPVALIMDCFQYRTRSRFQNDTDCLLILMAPRARGRLMLTMLRRGSRRLLRRNRGQILGCSIRL